MKNIHEFIFCCLAKQQNFITNKTFANYGIQILWLKFHVLLLSKISMGIVGRNRGYSYSFKALSVHRNVANILQ